jgi:hypothetical protein
MGLIGLGATAVVGVFGYNKWQEYRQRKLAEAVLKPHHEDVLLAKAGRPAPEAAPAVIERSEPEMRVEAPQPLRRAPSSRCSPIRHRPTWWTTWRWRLKTRRCPRCRAQPAPPCRLL